MTAFICALRIRNQRMGSQRIRLLFDAVEVEIQPRVTTGRCDARIDFLGALRPAEFSFEIALAIRAFER